MPQLKVVLLVLVSMFACTPRSNQTTPPPAGTEAPGMPGTNLGKPNASPAKLEWEVIDAAKFSQCSGSLTARIKLKNSGETAANWNLKRQEKSGLTFLPAQGTLQAHEELTIVVTGELSAADLDVATGKTNIEVIAAYEKGEASLKIQEAVQGVLLKVDASTLDFGIVVPGDLAQQQLTFTNLGKIDTQLRFGMNSEFPVNPAQLDLAAGASQTIKVSFHSLESRAYASSLLWSSSKTVCAAFNPSVKLQGQGSNVFKTAQTSVEWNQSCDRSPASDTKDINFSLRKNVSSVVSLETIEGPFTVDAAEWTVPANAQGTVKVSFHGKELRPETYRGRLTLKDKASGERVSFDLLATVIGSYLEIGTKKGGVFTPVDPSRGIEFSSSQILSSFASSPFNLDFINRGNRPAVVKFSLQSPITAPFISFPEASLTIPPGLVSAQTFPLWLQTHQIGKWATRLNFRYENDADAPLCHQPPTALPLHYTVIEDLDVEASALTARYACGTNDRPEFSANITNHSSRTIYVRALGLYNKSRTNSQLSFDAVEGVTFLRQSRGTVGNANFNNEYPLKPDESIKVVIQVTDRTRFESTFKTGEKVAFTYNLRPADSGNTIVREIDLNIDVAGAFLAVSPLDLNFGTVVANTKAIQSFQIKNEGKATAALTLSGLDNGFSLVTPANNALEIKPAATALITVAYTPPSFMNGSSSSQLDFGRAVNSCFSTGKIVRMSAVNSSEGLSFEPGSSNFGLSRGESMGKACDDVPMTSFSNRLRNMSSSDLKYKVSVRLNESLRSQFAASDLLAVQVDGQIASSEKVLTIPAKTLNGQGPALSLTWLKDIRTLSFEKYRLLAETQEIGKVVVTYADAVDTEITLPIKWGLARIIPSATSVDLGTLTTRGSTSFPFELNVLQNSWSYVGIITEFKDGSPGLTVTPSNPKLVTSLSEVLHNTLQVQLDPAWQAPSLSGTLKITATESQSRCPLLSEFVLPVGAQVKIKDLVVDAETSDLTVTRMGNDFRAASSTDCGTRADEKTIRIRNNGNFPISFLDFQWEALSEPSPFALTSSPSDLQRTLEPGATLFVKYRPVEAQRQNYYADEFRGSTRGFRRKLKATVSEDGAVRELNFSIEDMPRGYFLPKNLFNTVPSFRQIQAKGNVALKVPDFIIPVTGGLLSNASRSQWTVKSDFGQVQVIEETTSTLAKKLGAFMEFPAGFTGTSRMTWTLTHETLKNCSPNIIPIEGTKTDESIDVSLDPGNTVIGTAQSERFESLAYAYEDGNLTSQINFDRGLIVCGTDAQEQFINITNNTNQTVKVQIPLSEGEAWLPIQMAIPPIEPGKTGRIRVAVDSSRVATLGEGVGAGRYGITLVASGMPPRTLGSLRVIQMAAIDGKIVKAFVDGVELTSSSNPVNFGAVDRETTATRNIEWRIQGSSGNNQLEFRKSLVSPISDGTPESKLLDAFGSTIEREIFSVDNRKAVLSFKPSVTGDHSVKLQVVGGPAMKNVCSAPTIIVKGQGK